MSQEATFAPKVVCHFVGGPISGTQRTVEPHEWVEGRYLVDPFFSTGKRSVYKPITGIVYSPHMGAVQILIYDGEVECEP